VARGKITTLVDDAVSRLNQIVQGVDLSRRGNMNEKKLLAFDGVLLRLELLGRIADLGAALDNTGRKGGNAPIDALLAAVGRGVPTPGLPPRADRLEDSVALHAARTVGVYFMWKVRAMQRQLAASGVAAPSSAVRELSGRKQRFVAALTRALGARPAAEELRLALAGALVDHYVAFASLVHVKPPPLARPEGSSAADADEAARRAREHLVLVAEVPRDTQTLLLGVLSAAERALARRTKKALAEAEEDGGDHTDDEPEEDEPEDDADAAADEDASSESKLAASLVAEQRLCELAGKLVLGVWADVLDGRKEGRRSGGVGAVRRRLGRNRTRLGANFKAVVDALQRGAPHGVKATPAPSGGPKMTSAVPAGKKTAAKRKAPVEDDEESEQGEEDASEGGEEPEESPEREAPDMDLDSILGD
jgi:cohesin complex subunit SA-1/2